MLLLLLLLLLLTALALAAMQDKLHLLFRSSEHGMTPAVFWQRCAGKANTLTVVKVRHISE